MVSQIININKNQLDCIIQAVKNCHFTKEIYSKLRKFENKKSQFEVAYSNIKWNLYGYKSGNCNQDFIVNLESQFPICNIKLQSDDLIKLYYVYRIICINNKIFHGGFIYETLRLTLKDIISHLKC